MGWMRGIELGSLDTLAPQVVGLVGVATVEPIGDVGHVVEHVRQF